MIVRENLRNARLEKSLTQAELARMLEISEKQYRRLEIATSDGSIKVWQKLSRLFGRTIDYLLATKEEELFGAAPPNNSNHS